MVKCLTYSKTIRKISGGLYIHIPKEFVDKLDLKDREMIEVKVTKIE